MADLKQKRCFVISPIGAPGSDVREHADDVFEFIIKPAMDALGILVYRSDHSSEIGRITDQMFNSILTEDLCIAVLTYSNPNVFYELAIAQSAARPVIILIEKTHTIPFDVQDLRTVRYDLRPRPLNDKVYVRQIIEIVRNLDNSKWLVPVPFGKDLTPLGSRRSEMTVYDKLENYGPSDRWLGLLRSAKTSIDLSGLSLRWWTKLLEFRPLLIEKAREGCRVRCMLLPSLANMFHDKHERLDESYELQQEKALAWFKELAAASENIDVRAIKVGFLNHQIIKADDTMLLTIPLISRGPTSQFPILECTADSPLYHAMSDEFNALWTANETSKRPPARTNGRAERNGKSSTRRTVRR